MAADQLNQFKKTYSGFTVLLKWTVPLTVIVTLLVVVIIAP